MSQNKNPSQCSFCMEILKDPRILKACGHSICLSCAENQFCNKLFSQITETTLEGGAGTDLEGSTKGIHITCCECNAKTFIPLDSSPEKELPKNLDVLAQPTKDEPITIISKVQLKEELKKITGKDKEGFDNSSMQDAMFNHPYFLKYKQSENKLYISDRFNHIVRSISKISVNSDDDDDDDNGEWNGELKIEVGQPEQEGYSNGDRNTCKLRCPVGIDWDMNDNMYICNVSCICKVDSKTNQVSIVAGHEKDYEFKDGNNYEARFYGLSGILCYQQDHQSPLVFYASDEYNHCIRMIDVTNGKTTTFAGKGQEEGDVDGALQSARFNCPSCVAKDDENDHILYVADFYNEKIKMIDMKKGMVSTLVGGKDKRIFSAPRQIQVIDSFIYVACEGFRHCIIKIDKHSKLVTKICFNYRDQTSSGVFGITYHELDQCFYICDETNIYKLE